MSDEGEELATAVRRMLEAQAPVSKLRDGIDAGTAPASEIRATMADMGLSALPIADENGGQAAGWEITARVFEEFGRVLEPGTYLSTLGLALPVLQGCADDRGRAKLLPRIADGSLALAYALTEDGDEGWSFSKIDTTARPSVDGWQISGVKTAVLNAGDSDAYLVPASTDQGPGLFLVDRHTHGVTIDVQQSIDLTRPVAVVSFQDVSGEPVHRSGLTVGDLRAALDVSRLAIAAEAVGVAQACLDMAVGYAKERYQFGRAIGSFQAIKHMCADILLRLEGARSAVYAAGAALDEQAEDAAVYTCLAKLVAGDVARQASQANIQIHGALGFTWEHNAHLFYRRAIADSLLLGDSSLTRARLMRNLGVHV